MCIYMHMHKCVYMKKREKELFIDKFMLAIVLNSKDMLTKNLKMKTDPALMAYILWSISLYQDALKLMNAYFWLVWRSVCS